MGKSTDPYFDQLREKLNDLIRCKAQVEGRKAPVKNKWLEKVKAIKNEIEEFENSIGGNKSLNVKQKTIDVEKMKEAFNSYSISVNTTLKEIAKPYTYGEVENFILEFSNSKLSGDDGDIYTGEFQGNQLAVKVLPKEKVVDEIFTTEVNTIARASHRHVLNLYGFCFEGNMRALVFEYMENGPLDKVLYDNYLDLAWEKLYSIAIETAKGIAYLHGGCRKQIIHHDIRAHNVLLDKDLSPRVTGFGSAKLLAKEVMDHIQCTSRGVVGYAAPEMLRTTSRITAKCDVYSFGIMLFEILGKRRNKIEEDCFSDQVWEKFKDGKLDQIIRDRGILEKDREKATLLSTLALWCVQKTPEIRPSMSDVVMVLEKQILVTSPPNPFKRQPSQSMMLLSSPFIPITPTFHERNKYIDNDSVESNRPKEDNESQESRKRNIVELNGEESKVPSKSARKRLNFETSKQDELEKMNETGKSSQSGKTQSPEKPCTPKQPTDNEETSLRSRKISKTDS